MMDYDSCLKYVHIWRVLDILPQNSVWSFTVNQYTHTYICMCTYTHTHTHKHYICMKVQYKELVGNVTQEAADLPSEYVYNVCQF